MKHVIRFSLLTITLTLFVACFSSETPGKAALRYAGYIADNQLDKFIDGVVFDENDSDEEIKEKKEMLLIFLKEKGVNSIEEMGGIEQTKIISEVISADGNEAEVILEQTYKKYKASKTTTFNMVKKNGKWKMVVSK